MSRVAHLLVLIFTGEHTSDHGADGALADAAFAGQHENLYETHF